MRAILLFILCIIVQCQETCTCTSEVCLTLTPFLGDWNLFPDWKCVEQFENLATRKDFFSYVQFPPMDKDILFHQALRSGIHPSGIILNQQFYQFPFRIDTPRIRKELETLVNFDTYEGWSAEHHEIATRHHHLSESVAGVGELKGPFKPLHLEGLNYTRKVLAHFRTVIGNVGLMRLDPGREVEDHVDIHEYWDRRIRVHIPIATTEDVKFACGFHGEQSVIHMPAGYPFLFDNHESHWVRNDGEQPRIHLAFDTIGSRLFWNYLDKKSSNVDIDHPLIFEPWDDTELSDGICSSSLSFLDARLANLVRQWCGNIPSRSLQADSLGLLGAFASCNSTGSTEDFLLLDSLSSYLVDREHYPSLQAFI